MLETFANWALITYGDAAKTKTVTRQKYERIVDILKSESRDENSKFRFWVKSKGFFLATLDGEEVLCVPDFKAGAEASDLKAAGESFKRVAFVEDFFSIIYREHVRGDGRHVGQKRTYRAVSERYSFLPREAVSKFLSMCEVCQLRMQNSLSPSGHLGGPGSKRKIGVNLSVESSPENKGDEASLNNGNGSEEKPESFDEACSPKSDKSSSSVSGECSSKGDRDDEDDDDDDEDIDKNNRSVDPERLKAFNMFVRLFVDENLDRFVPISKQPKEKIQAIIDSCARQFPEFEDRARKRIRTYLKSCRRGFKRNKDGEPARPPSTQLNSVAESILATACENEASNAKRMRMGLDPIVYQADKTNSKSQTATASVDSNSLNLLQREDCFRFPFRPPDMPLLNGGGLFRAGAFPPPPFPLTTSPSLVPSHLVSNGSSDFKMKSLSSAETNAIKQMVAGFRESAAFLTRSAEELEGLLQQQS